MSEPRSLLRNCCKADEEPFSPLPGIMPVVAGSHMVAAWSSCSGHLPEYSVVYTHSDVHMYVCTLYVDRCQDSIYKVVTKTALACRAAENTNGESRHSGGKSSWMEGSVCETGRSPKWIRTGWGCACRSSRLCTCCIVRHAC